MRTIIIGAAVVATLTAGTAWAADQTLKGAVSDSMCGASHATMLLTGEMKGDTITVSNIVMPAKK